MSPAPPRNGATHARVIGLGQRLAGDDAVGLAVVEHLRARAGLLPPGAELLEAEEGSALVPWLESEGPLVVVDAVVGGGNVGDVVTLDAADVARVGVRPISTHGLPVADAIALAHAVHGPRAASCVRIVGVRIRSPMRGARGLSASVAAAVPRAAEAILACLGSWAEAGSARW